MTVWVAPFPLPELLGGGGGGIFMEEGDPYWLMHSNTKRYQQVQSKHPARELTLHTIVIVATVAPA